MEVTVKLFAYARKYHKQPIVKLQVKKGSIVNDVIKILNLPDEATRIILINGERKNKTTKLKDGDIISVFPMLAGG